MFGRLGSPVELEENILTFWDSNKIFERQIQASENKPRFVFYEGPPTANGTPHNGHVLTRVMKDVFPRYKSMRGFHVDRKAGWDTHGLPVEVEVEKRLNIHGKEAIEAFGMEAFSRECINSVFTYVQEWEELTKQIGFWVDLDEAYVTFHRSYVESVWWALSELFRRGLLYKGHKVVWWWPQGGTSLSAAEVGWGYKEVDDPAITVRFVDQENPKLRYLAWTTTPWTLPSNVGLAVGENLDYAVCDDPHEEGMEVVVAAGRCEAYGLVAKRSIEGSSLVGRNYNSLYLFESEEFPRSGEGRAFSIVSGAHVSADSGTGIVHTAPAFGEDDLDVAKANQLAMRQWILPNGTFGQDPLAWSGPSLKGRFCKETDRDIIADLRQRGLLFKRDTIRHSYPFCWRSDSDPLIQYARPAWFIRTTTAVKEVLQNNQATTWHPEHIQEGRFGDFLRNNVDWSLSRERFWGTPLNIWECTCGHRTCPSSTKEIRDRNPSAFSAEVDEHLQIHRPWVDQVTFPCDQCGQTMHRVPEVIDCWFDSGCMPFAQWGWPHQKDEAFKKNFPADFISEAVDQTRGWFYSLMMVSTLLFDDETCSKYGLSNVGIPRPYKNCIVLGHVCDTEGRKESKSKGNYTSPNLVLRGKTWLDAYPDASLEQGTVGLKEDQLPSLDLSSSDRVRIAVSMDTEGFNAKPVVASVKPKDAVHLNPADLRAIGLPETGGKIVFRTPGEPPGADAFRWLFCASNAPWSDTRLSIKAIRESQREFLIRLRNVYQFFAIYADIAVQKNQFSPNQAPPRTLSERHILDRWLMHRLQETICETTLQLDKYRLFEATKAISGLVEDLSNWYVRRSRARFWNEGTDLEDALCTLYETLVAITKLIAPFVPFTAEALWQELVPEEVRQASNGVSVHLVNWPEVFSEALNPELDEQMALVRDIASLGLSARAGAKIKVRQPLRKVTVVLANPNMRKKVEELEALILDELNVHAVDFASVAADYVEYTVKPDFKKLGARLGKDMKAVAAAVMAMDPNVAKTSLDQGILKVQLEGREIPLSPEEILIGITPKEGFQAASSAGAVVAIATVIDEELLAEGLVRELVNRVQNLRKEENLEYTKRIVLEIAADESVTSAILAHQEYLCRETLATEIRFVSASETLRTIELEGREVGLCVLK